VLQSYGKIVAVAVLKFENCPFSSGRQDLNLRLLGPKNYYFGATWRMRGSFAGLNYMKCIEFHRPGTIWAQWCFSVQLLANPKR
jgi:hypothetical protein